MASLKTVKPASSKTADDHRRIADLKFVGALWQHGGRPCLPARTLQAVVREAANRRGVQHRVRAAIFVEEDVLLLYNGPPSLDGLAHDPNFRMRTQVRQDDGSRRMCTRPCFPRWSASVAFAYDAGIINRADLMDLVMTAGDDVGIGAGRPRYARFAVTPTTGVIVDVEATGPDPERDVPIEIAMLSSAATARIASSVSSWWSSWRHRRRSAIHRRRGSSVTMTEVRSQRRLIRWNSS